MPPLQDAIEKEQESFTARRARAIRTYLTDMTEALRAQGASVASIRIAEQTRGEERARAALEAQRGREEKTHHAGILHPENTERGSPLKGEAERARDGATILYEHKEPPHRGVFFVAPPMPEIFRTDGENPLPSAKSRAVPIVATIFCIAAAGLLGYAGFVVWNTRTPVPVPDIDGPLPVSDTTTIAADNKTRDELIEELEAAAASRTDSEDTIVEIGIVRTLPDGTTTRLDSRELMDILAPSITRAFARSVVGPAFLGVRAGMPNELFLVLSIDFYENAFAGMLDFEERVPLDLPFLVRSVPEDAVRPTATDGAPEKFVDLLILNKDTRALVEDSFVRFIYSFPDTRTLVLAPSPETLRRVFALLLTPRFSR